MSVPPTAADLDGLAPEPIESAGSRTSDESATEPVKATSAPDVAAPAGNDAGGNEAGGTEGGESAPVPAPAPEPEIPMWPGQPFPLGATYDGVGTNFSLFSEAAEAVDLCLIDSEGRERRIRLEEVDGYCWHCYLPNVGPGQFYGYRVHGPYDPSQGLRCDPSKLLLDPYGKAFHGDFDGGPSLFSYPLEPSNAVPATEPPAEHPVDELDGGAADADAINEDGGSAVDVNDSAAASPELTEGPSNGLDTGVAGPPTTHAAGSSPSETLTNTQPDGTHPAPTNDEPDAAAAPHDSTADPKPGEVQYQPDQLDPEPPFEDIEPVHDLPHTTSMPQFDSLGHTMLSVVINPFFDWQNDRPPRLPYHQTVIYEAHVKGMTATHPDIPDSIRGTYAGLCHPVIIDHLKSLGITAIELMPVHQFMHDFVLLDQGLRNYWGYNTFGFFAPHTDYASNKDQPGSAVAEFKAMVRAFHRAGIEVILDVVYNHTAEGNHRGPTIAFRGIDNKAYYRVVEDNAEMYMDYTGTGNSLNGRHPHTLQLIMDSLRYWVLEMHVDGFRFDLASTLARELHDVDRLSAFFDLVQQDPVVSQVKLIAEPWDIGEGGYQVGNFPPLWTEWNGKYRDTVRDYWRGEPATLGEFASRLTGSSDLYEATGRRPLASINFVIAHDGFTLRDLFSYNEKHNSANGEDNRDGESHNRSWNCGVEGPTDDPEILSLRARQQRNILATLFISQGTPMLAHGDEIGRTQQGNNNVYCQDSELSWMDWSLAEKNADLLDFTRRAIALRTAHPVFRRRRFFAGKPIRWGDQALDIAWLTPSGEEMTTADWDSGFGKSLAVFLNGAGIAEKDERGEKITDDSFLICFNAHYESINFSLPPRWYGLEWEGVLDTANTTGESSISSAGSGSSIPVRARSLLVLRKTA